MRRLLLIAVLVTGCASAPPPMATALDLPRAQAQWPAVQLADLEQGRELLVKKCSGCHATPMPSEHRATDWPHALDEMSARASLAPSQQSAIEHYLVTLASRAH